MKKTAFLFAALTVLGFTACKKKHNAPGNSASAMFINGCIGTTKTDVAINGTTVQSASNLAFLRNSGYQYVTAGSDSILFAQSAPIGAPLPPGTRTTLTANMHYSIFTGGINSASSVVVASDDLSAPAAGNFKIRFVNLSISTDGLSETVSAFNAANMPPFATGITPQTYSPFAEVASGPYTIKAGDPSNTNSNVALNTQQFSAGKIYTVILTGTLTGTNSSALTLTVISNN